MHIFWCMGSKSWVKFQRCPLKFHTKFWTHNTAKMHFTRCQKIDDLWYQSYDILSLSETDPRCVITSANDEGFIITGVVLSVYCVQNVLNDFCLLIGGLWWRFQDILEMIQGVTFEKMGCCRSASESVILFFSHLLWGVGVVRWVVGEGFCVCQ